MFKNYANLDRFKDGGPASARGQMRLSGQAQSLLKRYPTKPMRLAPLASILVAFTLSCAVADDCVISSFAESTEAPHGRGNVYAADLVDYNGEVLMFFGGQGKDGHDRIHLATSADGRSWRQRGVVFAPEGVNHVNDPSVVIVDGVLHMFYTRAGSGVTDSIGLATSRDGLIWKAQGSVFLPGDPTAWDSLLVGRPSVIHDGKEFRMWYDGRKDLPPGAPDPLAPKSAASQRFVGYATSPDGIVWSRRSGPVFGEDAGGIHVIRHAGAFIMAIESRDGTKWASSIDGIDWISRGLLLQKGNEKSCAFGHVTPFLFSTNGSTWLYYGAAAAESWDQNSIHVAGISLPEVTEPTGESKSQRGR